MPALIKSSNGTLWDAETQINPDIQGNESRNSFSWNCYHSKLGKFFQFQIKDAILRALKAAHNKHSYSFTGDFLTLQRVLYESIKRRIQHDPERKQVFMFDAADILVYYAQNENELQKLQKNKLFRVSIGFAHRGILQYDKQAFVYEDERLQAISNILKTENAIFWKDGIISKVIDICVFLMKEDIYYRPRWIQIIQDIKPTVEVIPLKETSFSVLTTVYSLCRVCQDMVLTPEEIDNVRWWH